MQGATGTFDFLQDIGGTRRPDKRLGVFIVAVDIVSDRGDELFDIAKDATPNSPWCKFGFVNRKC